MTKDDLKARIDAIPDDAIISIDYDYISNDGKGGEIEFIWWIP